MDTIIRKYSDVIKNDVFLSHEKEFAHRIVSALSDGYRENLNEVPIVKTVEEIVKKTNDFKKDSHQFKLLTNAVFIHGNKSQVEFDYYGKPDQRELGDLIFIISVVFNRKKYFEKFTINSFKRDPKNSKELKWNISPKEQLYLLSRFPKFRGVKGLVPKKEYILPSYSGCLGSYGLLYRPGDFAFISATRLASFMGGKGTLKTDELYAMTDRACHYPYLMHPDIIGLYKALYWHKQKFHWYLPWGLFGNFHHAQNVFDFTRKYLRMGIGEPVYLMDGWDNPQARRFLQEIMYALKRRSTGGTDESKKISNFIDGFFEYDYVENAKQGCSGENTEFNDDGGGIGIIHTTIDLKEGYKGIKM